MNASRYRVIFSKTRGALVAVGETATGNGKSASGAGNRTRLATPQEPPSGDASWARAVNGKLRSLTAIIALMGSAQVQAQASLPSTALPTNGVVSSGSATIGTSGSTMTIQQGSNKASINWSSFNVGSAATVNIQQRTSSDVLLNRVVGSDPSQIMGKINANGKVLLINPNGIVFGKDGSVTATAFTASTFNISDENFQRGNYTFNRNGSSAGVVNHGTITTQGEGNYVALVGATVTNDGLIAAHKGDVVMAAGESVSLPANIGVPLGRSGRIRLQLSPASINAAVSNSANGIVTTEGGQVLLQAAAVGDAIASVVMAGKIDTTAAQGGAVTLQADQGNIKAAGSITANSTGAAAGGDIMIGRDTQTGILAKRTDVSNARLESKGGFVETSGDWLATAGANIKAKDWLLDPTDIKIVASCGSCSQTPSSTSSNTKTFQETSSNSTSFVLASDIANTLGNGTNVTVKTTNGSAGANGDITVEAPIEVNNSGGDATLTLLADKKITLNTGAHITRNGSNKLNVVLNSNTSGGSEGITLNASIAANGGTVTLKAGAGTTSTWDFMNPDSNAVRITADKLELLGTGATFVINNPNNSVNTLAADAGSVTFSNNKAITVGTVNGTSGLKASSGNLGLTAAGSIALDADVSATKGIRISVNDSHLSNAGEITAKAGTNITNTGTGGINVETTGGNIAVANISNSNSSGVVGNVVIAAGKNLGVGNTSKGNVTRVGTPTFSNTGKLYIYTGSYSGFGDITGDWNSLTNGSTGFSKLYANNPYQANNVGFGKVYDYAGNTALDMTGNPGATSQVVFRETNTGPSFTVDLSGASNTTVQSTYGDATGTALSTALTNAYTGSATLTNVVGANTFSFEASDVINDVAGDASLPALTPATTSSSGKRKVGTYAVGSLTPTKTLTGVTLTTPTNMQLQVNKKAISVSGIAGVTSEYGSTVTAGAASFATGEVFGGDKVSVNTIVNSTGGDFSTGGKLRAKTYTQSTNGLVANTDANSVDSGNYELSAPFTTATANYVVDKKVVAAATIGSVNTTYGTDATVGGLSLGTSLVSGDQVTVGGTVVNAGATNLSSSGHIKANTAGYDQTATGVTLSSANGNGDADNYILSSSTATAANSYVVNKKTIATATIDAVNATYGTDAAVGGLSLGTSVVDGDQVAATGTVVNAGATNLSSSGHIKANPAGYDQTATGVALTSTNGNGDADNYTLVSTTATAANSYVVNKKVVAAATIGAVNATYGTDAAVGDLSLGTSLVGGDQVTVGGTVVNAGATNLSSSGHIKANPAGYDQTATGVTLSSANGNGDADNYILSGTTATAANSYVVNKKVVAAATIGAVNATYGTDAAVGGLSLGTALVGGDQVAVTGTVVNAGASNLSSSGHIKANTAGYDQTATGVALSSTNGNGDADNYALASTTATAANSYVVNKKVVAAATIGAVNATYGTDAGVGALSLGTDLVGNDQVIVGGTVVNAGATNLSSSGHIKANPSGYNQTATGVALSSGNSNGDADNYALASTTATAANSYVVNKKVVAAATIGAVNATYGTDAGVGALSLGTDLVGNDQVIVGGTVVNAGASNLSTSGHIKANAAGYDQTATGVALSSGNSNGDADNYALASTTATAANSYVVNKKVVAAATIGAVNATYGTDAGVGALSLGTDLVGNDQVTVGGTVVNAGATNLSSSGHIKANTAGYDQTATAVALSSGNSNGDADNYALASTTATAANSYVVNKKVVAAATIGAVNATYGTDAGVGALSLGTDLVGNDQVIVGGTVVNAGASNLSSSGHIKANPSGYDQTATGVALSSGNSNGDADNYALASTTATAANSYVVNKKVVAAATIGAVNATYGTDAAVGGLSLGTALVSGDQVAVTGTVVNAGAANLSSSGHIKANTAGYDQTATGVALSSTNGNGDADNYALASTTATAVNSFVVNKQVVTASIDSVDVTYGTSASGTLSLATGLVVGDKVNVSGTVTNSGAGNLSTGGFVKASNTAYDQSATNIALSSGNANGDADNYALANTTATAAQSYKVNKKVVAATIDSVNVTYGTNAVGTLSLGTALVVGDKVAVTGTVSNSGANNLSSSGFVRASDTAYDQTATNLTLSSANANNDADNYALSGTTATAAQSYKVDRKVVAATISPMNVDYGTSAVGTLSLGTALVTGDRVNVNGTVTVSGASTGGLVLASDTAYDQTATNVTLSSANANNDADNYRLSATTVTAPNSYKVNSVASAANTLPNTAQANGINTPQASRVTLSAEPAYALSSANLQEKQDASNNLTCMDFHLVDKLVPANAVTVCHQSGN